MNEVTAYVEVGCASLETPHAYTIAAPLDRNEQPLVPRYCAHCPPPAKTDETGIAIDRKANVHGGVFIKTWRFTKLDDYNQPVDFPAPIQVQAAA